MHLGGNTGQGRVDGFKAIGDFNHQLLPGAQQPSGFSSEEAAARAMDLQFVERLTVLRRMGTERGQLIKRLAQVLSQLPETELLVVSLHYHEKLDLKDVASVLDRSEFEVLQLYRRALTQICTF